MGVSFFGYSHCFYSTAVLPWCFCLVFILLSFFQDYHSPRQSSTQYLLVPVAVYHHYKANILNIRHRKQHSEKTCRQQAIVRGPSKRSTAIIFLVNCRTQCVAYGLNVLRSRCNLQTSLRYARWQHFSAAPC